MVLRYDPRNRSLDIAEVSGQFEWKRLFYDAQSDSGSLTDVTGEVGEVPPGGQILKPRCEIATTAARQSIPPCPAPR